MCLQTALGDFIFVSFSVKSILARHQTLELTIGTKMEEVDSSRIGIFMSYLMVFGFLSLTCLEICLFFLYNYIVSITSYIDHSVIYSVSPMEGHNQEKGEKNVSRGEEEYKILFEIHL